MSDCSMAAFEPRERRTCGTCNNCDFDGMECSYIEEDGTHQAVTMDTPACADWERRVITDEERFERLAQVAREMYDALASCTYGCSGECPMLNDGCDVDTGVLRSRLIALGGERG